MIRWLALLALLASGCSSGLSESEKASHRLVVAAQFCVQDCWKTQAEAARKHCPGPEFNDCTAATMDVATVCEQGCGRIPPARFKPEYDHPEKLGR